MNTHKMYIYVLSTLYSFHECKMFSVNFQFLSGYHLSVNCRMKYRLLMNITRYNDRSIMNQESKLRKPKAFKGNWIIVPEICIVYSKLYFVQIWNNRNVCSAATIDVLQKFKSICHMTTKINNGVKEIILHLLINFRSW